MKFRLKPHLVEAEQFFVERRPRPEGVCFCVDGRGFAHVHTWKGIRRIQNGDWVVRSESGAVYALTDQALKNKYEHIL